MKLDSNTELYFEFIKYCLKDEQDIPSFIKEMDWEGLYQFGKEQAILGVLFKGIERLKDSAYKPSVAVIMRFYAYYNEIVKLNRQVYQDANKLSLDFKEKYGINTCIMKGQANALMYPDPWVRQPGDIDVWTDADTVDVIKLARQLNPKAELGYHHIEIEFLRTPVELHFFPSFMGNLFYEWRLRAFFDSKKSLQFQNKKALPDNLGSINCFTKDFDSVFQLSHLMHHFFFEGIGLRQMVDYFYLLKQGFTEEEKRQVVEVIKRVNMFKFATGVMYIMKESLGLEDKYLLMQPNARIGKMLEKEIVLAGNFGFYDTRFKFRGKSVYAQYLLELYRNLHFAIDFPSETVWGRPISRWWHMVYKANAVKDRRKSCFHATKFCF